MGLKITFWNTTVFALLVATLGCGVPAPMAEPPAELVQPKPKLVPYDTGQYRGIVTAVGADWLELGANWKGATGRKMQLDHTKSKRVSGAGTTPGGDPNGERQRTHRVSDLKIGDVVVVTVDISRDGEEWTSEIQIERRPGGKIPPQYGDPYAETTDAFHLRDQAEQDWEEKGVPIPKKYLSDGRAPWTNPPYPPVAPMPRAANAKP